MERSFSPKTVRFLQRLRDGGHVTVAKLGRGASADVCNEILSLGGLRKETHGSRQYLFATPIFSQACRAVDPRLADLDALLVVLTENLDREDRTALVGDSKTGPRKSVMRAISLTATSPIEVLYRSDTSAAATPFTISPECGLFFTPSNAPILPVDIPILIFENERCRWNHSWIGNIGLEKKPYFLMRRDGAVAATRTWLASLQNEVLYFPDYDLMGINIYEKEYKRHLKDRIAAIIPRNMEDFVCRVREKGNASLYNKQLQRYGSVESRELEPVLDIIKQYRKGYEQEGYCDHNRS